ncbi:hypothetical protein MNBD_IGNAVI01-831 [hydrothermal vent metagenome]|uniref:Tetratricopeptide repeat protein n=1 Tax=hydrothermal vent metagenome TaxID=652676 RepID=A0A3B1CA81_9ZZZZ
MLSNFFAQGLNKQYNYADSLFSSGNYFDAITEYKRLLFFDRSEQFKYQANFNIGLSYKFGGKYDEAINYFGISELSAETDSQKMNSRLQIIRVNILRRTTNNVFAMLDELHYDFPEQVDSSTIAYWRGWAYIMADDWENASLMFDKIDGEHPLKKLADEVEDNKYSITFATLISYILPGSGQIYTGNYLSGFLSLGWNVLWGYLTIHAFVGDRVLEGILIGGLLWARFYRGNFKNAEKFAIEKNIEISNKAYRYLKNNYKGIKP